MHRLKWRGNIIDYPLRHPGPRCALSSLGRALRTNWDSPVSFSRLEILSGMMRRSQFLSSKYSAVGPSRTAPYFPGSSNVGGRVTELIQKSSE